MESPYFKTLKLRNLMKDTVTECSPSLGISLRNTRYGGSSASGMKLGIGEYRGIPMFIKIFPMICPFKKYRNLNGEIIKVKPNDELDKDAMEIGFTRLLSDLLFDNIPFTQNITAFYFFRQCNNAYKSDISLCSLNPIDSSNYVVSGENRDYPHDSLMNNYIEGLNDDIINFIGVELCSGDLENYFKTIFIEVSSFNRVKEHRFEQIMDSIFMQIILTIYCLNFIFQPFHHSDLGPRNILYTSYSQSEYNNTYFQYIISENIFNVENVGIIPKLWDFSNIYINEEQRIWLGKLDYFSYLRERDRIETVTTEVIHNISQLCNGIIILDEFRLIEYTIFARKIRYIASSKIDNFPKLISMFNNYQVKENDTLLEPVFKFN